LYILIINFKCWGVFSSKLYSKGFNEVHKNRTFYICYCPIFIFFSCTKTWQYVGEVVGVPKQSFQGREYDFVFDIDVGKGMPLCKLPYNLSGSCLFQKVVIYFHYFFFCRRSMGFGKKVCC
jgi:hypothetical protein